MKEKFFSVVLSLFFLSTILMAPITSSATPENGWDRVGDLTYYYVDGERARGFLDIDGSRYYFRNSGTMVKGWQYISGNWYYFRQSGTMVRGWQYIGGNWYYFRNSGSRVKGWQKIGDHWYFFRNSGTRVESRWEWLDSKWKFFNSKGESMDQFWEEKGRVWLSQAGPFTDYAKGWRDIGENRYFFRLNSGTRVSGEQYIGGHWYYFRGSGTMAKDWQYIGGVWKFFDADGIRTIHAWVSLDRDYDWYMNQMHTGEFSSMNCSPTTLAMILKWLDPNSTVTGEEIYQFDPHYGNGWFQYQACNYLDSMGISYQDVPVKSQYTVLDLIDRGSVISAYVEQSDILYNPEAENGSLYGKYDYYHDGGHNFVIMGYQIEDEGIYYMVFEPGCSDVYYANGDHVGKYRLYAADQVLRGMYDFNPDQPSVIAVPYQ